MKSCCCRCGKKIKQMYWLFGKKPYCLPCRELLLDQWKTGVAATKEKGIREKAGA